MPFSSLKRFSSAAARFISRRPHATAAALALLALVAHLHFFIASADSHERWDSKEYLASAKSLAAGEGFRDQAGHYEARRTPLYPAFLTLFAPVHFNETCIVSVQHFLAILLVVALFYGTRLLTGDPNVAAFAAALLAVNSGEIYTADLVMTETLASIFIFAIVFLLARGKVASAGLMTGLATLLRPVAMYLWIPLAIFIAVVYRRRPAGVILFLLFAWTPPALWMWRNYERAGVFALSSIQGEDLYYWRAAGAIAIERSGFEYSPLPFSGEERFRYQFFRVVQKEFRRDVQRRLGAREATMTDAQISEFEGALAKQILRKHVRGTVLVTIYGALHLIFDTTWQYADAITGFGRVALIWWLFAMAVVSFVLAIIGFVRLRRLHPQIAWLLAITLMYFVAVSSGPEHEQWRYRVPLMPLYSILIACCIIRPHAGLLRTEDR